MTFLRVLYPVATPSPLAAPPLCRGDPAGSAGPAPPTAGGAGGSLPAHAGGAEDESSRKDEVWVLSSEGGGDDRHPRSQPGCRIGHEGLAEVTAGRVYSSILPAAGQSRSSRRGCLTDYSRSRLLFSSGRDGGCAPVRPEGRQSGPEHSWGRTTTQGRCQLRIALPTRRTAREGHGHGHHCGHHSPRRDQWDPVRPTRRTPPARK